MAAAAGPDLTAKIVAAGGCSFLLESRAPEDVFTPEDFSEEQRQIAATAARFAAERVMPALAQVEAKEPGVMRGLLRQAAELGFVGVDIPEEYGGLGLDKVTSALVADQLSVLASFSTAFGAHAGIGTLPLVWYGTAEQKQRYLPRLAEAEWIAAYALSEATSGSDAMNVRTQAVLSEDGRYYVVNGEKMWITNAGTADLFTVFVKIVDPASGEGRFSALLMERGTGGFSIGKEEHKLGIRGSSTCALVFSDCRVPVENLLGEVGKGHHIAFNILNMGRLKLGAACLGGARGAIDLGVKYARDRKAFGKPIAEFGAIEHKIARSVTRLFVAESMVYRTVGMMDAALAGLGEGAGAREVQKCIEEYAVECSILKVFCSEMLDLVADELVQIMAGYGYVEDYPAERIYRDSRINRIFEGTNEINRLIISGWVLKRAMSGQVPLLPAIRKLMDEITQPVPSASGDKGRPLAHEEEILGRLRKMTLLAAGVASQRFGAGLPEQQLVMMDLADGIQAVYALESALLRARKLGGSDQPAAELGGRTAAEMTALYAEEALAGVEMAVRRVLAASAEGDALNVQMAVLRRYAKVTPTNVTSLSHTIARYFVAQGRYRL